MKKTVMLVEDTLLHRKLFSAWLELCDYEVRVVSDERLAVIDAENVQPAAIIVDIFLPHVDGRDVIRNIRRNTSTRHIPIFALSVLSSEADQESCYSAGATVFKSKSIRYADFVSCMREITTT